ncbi:FAD/NAD(P)-binding domain-containing protein [Microthyrium microscopicum]|uniref:FAD/NAD(P)-binding domain-containing protein n=1 Tax=Microthyrium microscopicum TaxID=703497 RepID=A0A6A6U0L6_9PEZI|nr:FAD/NAD(P)-binding domain-containing protein [Microthyrium microscopicum]
MAATQTQFSNPHSVPLPVFGKLQPSSPQHVASEWLSKFESVVTNGDASRLGDVFHEDCWWRDLLSMSWDYHTLQGLSKVKTFAQTRMSSAGFKNFKLREQGAFTPAQAKVTDTLSWVESIFSFETSIGRGQGVLRLTPDADGAWKAYIVYTSLQELKSHEWATGANRPHGGKNTLEGGIIKGNWVERKQRQKEFLDNEPTCLIIGAGQAGLMIAARLQALGVSCLLVDRNQRIGDNWRLRYRTLVTHDPVYTCHMPYMPFPSTWPFFTAKDKLADWFESYAELMDLNVWMNTNLESATWSEDISSWTATVKRGEESTRTFHPKHVIFATGHSGEPKIPSFPGQSDFKGTIYHGSQHQDASTTGDATGKRVIVVGTGNSGHDIAQNYCENGARVTMLQRRTTHVVKADTGLLMMTEALYGENSPPTEDADLYAQSFPVPVNFALMRATIKAIAEAEKENLQGLQKAGFKLNDGVDGSGLFSLYYTRGGGYYIDVGCSQLIIDGKIKIEQSPNGIKGFDQDGLILADGRRLEADIVVLATGYDNMRTSLRKALGDEIADKCKDVWDLDDEGEMNAMWRPSGHRGLWYMGGNLSLCRQYSKFLALQIKAIEVGLSKGDAVNSNGVNSNGANGNGVNGGNGHAANASAPLPLL